jgi:putative endonuclease
VLNFFSKNPVKLKSVLRDFFWGPSLNDGHGLGMTESSIVKGSRAEQRAVDFLIKKSFDILEQNYRIPAGELDIVALHEGTLVFVEVKFLQTNSWYNPEEQVTVAKRRRCEKAALSWLNQNPHDGDCRFDVIAMVASGSGELLHFEDAWQEGE